LAIALVVVFVAGLAAFLWLRKRRTARLRTRFGEAEYARAVEIGGNRRHAEAALTEDLRQAMVCFRTLFEELVNEPELPLAKAAS
jgi:hypothetical protein